ncbi:zona pellucida sperm-binding protein 4-like [Spinachia spinachia]
MRSTCRAARHTSHSPKMEALAARSLLATPFFLWPLLLACPGRAASTCHEGAMSVNLSKAQYADLPHTIYVKDEHGGYYQAIAVAEQCHYFFGEAEGFTLFTVSGGGCFVRREEYSTRLTVVIMALADEGGVEIAESISIICERKRDEAYKDDDPQRSTRGICNKDGFHVTVLQNATVPPLNLDAVWIPSGQDHHNCRPRKTSADAVTFSFPFTDCGTQSVMADGIITHWVAIEVKRQPQKSLIFHDAPFHRTVHCSFALAQITQVGFEVRGEESGNPSTLESEGKLRAEMRFAKDSDYKSFYSSRDPQVVTELGQSVHVDVFARNPEGEDLVLLLEDCWATPSENPHDRPRRTLLVKGCPFSGDGHRTVVLPVVPSELMYPSLHKWFVVKPSSFVEPPTLKNLVYFHCDVKICKGPDCLQSCSNGGRKFGELRQIQRGSGREVHYSLVSGGPLLYLL